MRATVLALLLSTTAPGLLAADYQAADPGWMPARLYFFGGSLRPRVMELIADPAAPTGQAAHAKEGVQVGGMAADSYSYEGIPGHYVTKFFFKVADNTRPDAVVSFGMWGAIGPDPTAGGDGMKYLKATDFKQPGIYQEFTYEWDYYEYGFQVDAVNWLGKGEIWWGGVETRLVKAFTDDELLSVWKNPPAVKYYVPFPPKDQKIPEFPADLAVAAGVPKVHMVEGMYYDRFGVEEAIKSLPGASLTESETSSNAQVADIAPKFPGTDDLFAKHNVVIMANVDLRRLGVLRRLAIKEFVNRGGGLLVLGGPWTYGRSAVRGTWIDDLLPVGVKGRSDWVHLPAGSALQWTDQAPAGLRAVPLGDHPCVSYVHDVDLRATGKVALTAGGRPVLVLCEVGKGRVGAFTGTAMGDPGPGSVGFWESNTWPGAMAALLRWLSRQNS
jgi:uncharacterized membrane protein